MWAEFKGFLLKTNALALAVGVIIGGALGTVVNSLVNDIIMPPIGYALGGVDFASLKIVLKPVCLAQPPMEGTMAGLLPTLVSFSTRPWNNEPMIDSCTKASPSFSLPLAWSCAMRAEVPVPQGERSIALSP